MPKKSVTIKGEDLRDLRDVLEYVAESEREHYEEMVEQEGADAMTRHVYNLATRLQDLIGDE